jgi:L-idonate 5-dehydrogenase
MRPVVGGICGSDLHYFASGRVGSFVLQEPLVLGHEVVGVVEDDPTGTFESGARVAVHPATPDRICPECLAGTPNVCRHGRYLGSAATLPHTQGAFAEQIAVRPDQLRRLPEDLPMIRAVLAEPLAVGIHAINRAGGVAGKRVLVTGAGPIGLLAAGAAVALGTGVVESESADVVLEASGAPAALTTAVVAVARRGTIIQIGMLPGEPRPVALAPLIAKEASLLGAFRFDTELDEAIALLAARAELGTVVSHRYPLDDALTAFEVAADASRSSKVVLDLSTGA